MHSGTDFFAAWSDTVYATGDGLINKSSWNFGYGRQIKFPIVVVMNLVILIYIVILLRLGDSVKMGEPIARAGNSGMVTGPHLHYEISRWDKTIDPMDYKLLSNPVSRKLYLWSQ